MTTITFASASLSAIDNIDSALSPWIEAGQRCYHAGIASRRWWEATGREAAIAALFDVAWAVFLVMGFCIALYKRLRPVAAQVSAAFIAYAATDGRTAVRWYRERAIDTAKLCRRAWGHRAQVARAALGGCDRLVEIALQVG